MKQSESFWKFVSDNIKEDVTKLRLKYYSSKNLDFDIEFAITQIDSRRRCKKKLPLLLSNDRFLFPSTLSAEQSTSELLASFHSSLLPKGARLLDMTCGLGVDVIYASKICAQVTAIDINPLIADCLKCNSKLLCIDNVNVITEDSIDYLSKCNDSFDVIFVDPARRSYDNKRTFAFSDCMPDVVANIDIIRNKCKTLIIKASPMLDVGSVIKLLDSVTDVWILSVRNECKELVVKCSFIEKCSNQVSIHALNFVSDSIVQQFFYSHNDNEFDVRYLETADEIGGKWLYEPNASVMKCGCWSNLVKSYPEIIKLHPNTHLFISDIKYSNFPGRITKILSTYVPKSADLRRLKGEQFNVICRNYPETPDMVKRKYKISDGSKKFLYCVKVAKERNLILIAE